MERFAGFLYRVRIPLVLLLLAVTALLATRTEGLDLDNTLTAWFPDSDPDYRTYRAFQDDFSGNRNLLVVIEAGDVFAPELLDYITRATDAIEDVDFVERVYSL